MLQLLPIENPKSLWRSLSGGVRPRITRASVPEPLRKLFNEAVAIEAISVRGACGLLRTYLEALLLQHLDGKGDLADLMDAAAKADFGWPETLLAKLHLVRLLGNFGVHWMVDDKGAVIDVDAGELEAMFGAVEQAFRVVFIEPPAAAQDVERINKKLEAVGKPMRIGPAGAMVAADGGSWPPPKKKKEVQ